MVDIQMICNEAIEAARHFGVEFSYQPEDIEQMDSVILPKCRKWLDDGTLTEQGAWNVAVMFGVYLGETMLRNFAEKFGYHWGTPDGNLPVLMKDKGNRMSPITKTHKCLLNGEEDSVYSFYTVSMLVASGKLF